MSLVDGYTYLDTQLIRALAAAACDGPTAEQAEAAPEALVRYCHAGPRQVRDLYPWGQRRRYHPRMVRALVRDLVEREQLAASDPVGLADWSWVWHPDTATGPGTPPPLDPAEWVATPEEAEPVEEPEGEDDEEAPPAVDDEEEDDGLTRDQRRSARPREVRAQTQSVRTTSKRSLLVGAALYPEDVPPLPATRAECVDGPRPCPRVSCRHHLYLDVDPHSGSIKRNFPDIEVENMGESCSLDVADRGALTLEGVGPLLNLTRERIRQIEVNALKRFAKIAHRTGIEMADLLDLDGKPSAPAVESCEAGILALLREGERDLSDLTRRLDYPRGTVTNQITALIRAGLIERVGRGRYRLVGREAAE